MPILLIKYGLILITLPDYVHLLPIEALSSYSSIIFDFDGVILDTLPMKAAAFASLFPNISPSEASRIKNHHFSHGGVSRMYKIPLYATWAGLPSLSDDQIANYSEQFSFTVSHLIRTAPPLPGVLEYIKLFHTTQQLYIASASALSDLNDILPFLGINKCFRRVYGSPPSKIENLHSLFSSYDLQPSACCFIGDSVSDFDIARRLNLDFFCIVSQSMYSNSPWPTYHPRQEIFNGILL